MRNLIRILISALLALSAVAAAADSPEQLLAAGRADDAIRTLGAKIQSAPNDAAAYNLLCRAYFSMGNWDRGVSACEKAVSLEPNNSHYHLWLGRIYGEKADNSNFMSAISLAKKVRSEFEAAVQFGPDNVDAHTDLAEFYLEAPGIVGGGKDKAEAQARTLATMDPGKSHWVTARIAQKNHEDAAAEKEYRAAVEASHGSAIAWLNLAFFYHHTNRLNEMEDAINHATSAQMSHPEVLMEGAETLLRSGRNVSGAVQMLQRYIAGSTVEQAPAFKAHYLLGTALEKQGDTEKAAQEYRIALSMASGFSRAQDALKRLNR